MGMPSRRRTQEAGSRGVSGRRPPCLSRDRRLNWFSDHNAPPFLLGVVADKLLRNLRGNCSSGSTMRRAEPAGQFSTYSSIDFNSSKSQYFHKKSSYYAIQTMKITNITNNKGRQ